MSPSQATILLVEDFLPDRELYRRYLEADEQYSYQIFETETGEEALSWCQELIPDVILLDYRLSDIDGLEVIDSLKQIFPDNLPIIVMLTGEGNEAVAIEAMKKGVSDYLIKRKLTADILNDTLHQLLIERRQQELLQARQELVTSIGLRIRQYLTVSDIFKSIVEEVGGFLECDRVLVYEFAPDMSGTIVAESVGQGWTAILNNQIVDTCFQSGVRAEYQQGLRRSIDNIYEAGLTECHLNLLEKYQVKANLVVPILLSTTSPLPTLPNSQISQIYPTSSYLWGLLIAHQCSDFRQWEKQELDLLEELAKQIALTLQPAFLFEKIQQENYKRQKLQENLTQVNRTLEAQVAERTEALRQSEQKFRSSFETAAVGMCLASLQCQFLEVNLSACQMLGYSEAELLNMTCKDVTHPEDKETDTACVLRLLGGETSVIYEKRYLHKNGRIIWVLFSIALVRNLEQEPLYFIAQFQDITERQRAEEALNISMKRYRELFEGSVDGIAMVDLESNFLDCNQSYEKMLGYTKAELQSKKYSDITPVKWHEMETQIVSQQILKRGYSELYEKEYIRKDGTIFPIELIGYCVYNEAGEPASMWALARDISFRKQAELAQQKAKEAAEAANLAKSTFLASISHELRTPLNAILGFSQLLNRSENLNQDEQENICVISKSAEHLLNLINQILDVTKNEAGLTTLNETAFDLYYLLEEVEEMFQQKARSKKLQLFFEQANNVPQYVKTDAVKLRQILINIISNAIKFTQEGGVSVRISSQAIEPLPNPPLGKEREQVSPLGKVYFEIEDTGLGIAEDELAQLFQAFVQTKSGKQLQQGTGLGLMISQQFIRLMGGEITVNSQVGSGSIFKFNIQVKIVECCSIKMLPSSRKVIALEPNQPRYRILIVDDDFDNRRLLFQLLYPFGFELQEASNGQEAVNIWLSYSPHLIFMDLRMPVINGFEATKLIKSSDQGQSTVIIAVSASKFEEQQNIVLSAGCDDFIGKPFKESEIFDVLNKHLGVRFVYSELAEECQIKTSLVLTPEVMAVLPKDWLASFHESAMRLDFDGLLNLITEIQEQHQSIANALAEMVKNYEFDELLALTEIGNG